MIMAGQESGTYGTKKSFGWLTEIGARHITSVSKDTIDSAFYGTSEVI